MQIDDRDDVGSWGIIEQIKKLTAEHTNTAAPRIADAQSVQAHNN
jgi:hypothetical protein